MKTQHTKGPWETSSNGAGQWDICGPGAGDMIADLANCENAEANARLIAAAPDLLAALEDARETLDSFLIGKIPQEHRITELERVLQLMNQAAAKATGT